MDKINAKQNFWRGVKFTLFSISAGIVEVVSFTFFNEVMHLNYWIGYLTALILSVLWNFTLNRRYTFRSSANIPLSMFLIFLFYCVFTPVSTIAGDKLEAMGMNEYLVLGLTMLVNFILEFLYYKYVVYRNSIDTNKLAKAMSDNNENTD